MLAMLRPSADHQRHPPPSDFGRRPVRRLRGYRRFLALALVLALVGPAIAADQPQILRIGDSISGGWAGGVERILADEAALQGTGDNCRHTAYTLEHLDDWLADRHWDLIVWNNGLWDMRLLKEGDPPRHQIELPAYRENLRRIATRLRQHSGRILFLTTTPVRWEDEVQIKKRRNVDVRAYNAAAVEEMAAMGIPVLDLYGPSLAKIDEILSEDGVHYNKTGRDLHAELVSTAIRARLTADTAEDSQEGAAPEPKAPSESSDP